MNNLGSNDDCYFYYYSSCTKGDECPFRHCEAALGTETVCSLWREGRCMRDNCKFRHMESRINRGTIPCYWEDQPSGCLKPHCVFWHRKLRTNVKSNAGNDGLILPVSTTLPQISPSVKIIETKEALKNGPLESYSNIDDNEDCPASIPIEPIVFSFDNEESDSESASSTPVKSALNDSTANSLSAKKNLCDALSNHKNDFGIKTLEQIKMEKIHKESDNFYKSAYDAPLIAPPAYDEPPSKLKMKSDNFKTETNDFYKSAYDAPLNASSTYDAPTSKLKMKTDNFKAEIYPPKSEFISIPSRPVDSLISATIEYKDHSSENEKDIRNRILKRRNVSAYSEKSAPPKKVISLKKTKDNDPLDFKVKTLDEIRKEKMNKLGKEEREIETSSQKVSVRNNIIGSTSLNEKETPNTTAEEKGTNGSTNINEKETANMTAKRNNINGSTNLKEKKFANMTAGPFRKLRLKRSSNDTLANCDSTLQEADSSSDSLKKERNQMILHEVQNISEDKSDSKAFLGKRKEIPSTCAGEKSPKQLKSDSSSSPKTVIDIEESDTKQIKSLHPVIKRKRSTSLFQLPMCPNKEISSTVENVLDSTVPEKDKKIVEENNLEKDPRIEENNLSNEDKCVSKTEKITHKSSVDDIDNFLLNEAHVNLDYEQDISCNESEDLLLEIEQLLES